MEENTEDSPYTARRLCETYGFAFEPGDYVSPERAIDEVAAAWYPFMGGTSERRQVPDEAALGDALALIADARHHLDYTELVLVSGLRSLNVTWERIGQILEYPAGNRRQNAATRARRLREKFPTVARALASRGKGDTSDAD